MQKLPKKEIRASVAEKLSTIISGFQIEHPSKKTTKLINKISKKLTSELNDELKKQFKKMKKVSVKKAKSQGVAKSA